LKKSAGSVQFRFYKSETEKTEPNRTQIKKNRKKTESKQSQTRKTEPKPSQTGKFEPKPRKFEPKPGKPSQNQESRAKPVWTGFCPKKPNQTETSRFEPVSVFFFNFGLVIFFNKNQTEPKMITPNFHYGLLICDCFFFYFLFFSPIWSCTHSTFSSTGWVVFY